MSTSGSSTSRDRAAPPRGILKNANSTPSSNANGLAWDEANLSLNEVQKDSTMKITEPKTPYVRYNAETDEVMDLDKIPGFELGQTSLPTTSPHSPPDAAAPARADSNPRRGSSGSEKLVRVERTNSFTSPSDRDSLAGSSASRLDPSGGPTQMNLDRVSNADSDDDDEPADEETKEHRKQFAQKRGRHYSNEAEAMKRAQALLANEDDDEDEDEAGRGRGYEDAIDDEEEEDSLPHLSHNDVPPVPTIPPRFESNGNM
ncbi:phosphatase inhibitor 2 family protein [Sporobolomyces koalae]|uniref:phosphatase inhibitor 2 family protein n=1 Tax=Sporobolomyces koalae TaxID=500713 RepID=UPI00316E7D1D